MIITFVIHVETKRKGDEIMVNRCRAINCSAAWRINYPHGKRSKARINYIREHDKKCIHNQENRKVRLIGKRNGEKAPVQILQKGLRNGTLKEQPRDELQKKSYQRKKTTMGIQRKKIHTKK